jgi:LysM repeat protein
MKSRLLIVLVLVALLAGLVPLSGVHAESCKWHIVKRGENLTQIARHYGVSRSAILKANPKIKNPNLIYKGQRLCIPKSSPKPPPPPPPGTCETGCWKTYYVKPGEWLKLIGERYGKTAACLARVNKLSQPDYIYPGQKLRIPVKCAPKSPPPPPAPLKSQPAQPAPRAQAKPLAVPSQMGEYWTSDATVRRKPIPPVQCVDGEFLKNGHFERGFYGMPHGDVGNMWVAFHNGGEATYGFYDDTWPPVVADCKHSQLIEINTFCRGGSDSDRYAGIYQKVHGLKKGARYKLSMVGMMRALADDEDREKDAYRVQWGYTANGSTNPEDVRRWVTLPWTKVYVREEPGPMLGYSTIFQAPSDKITIFIRAWKKWGTTRKEFLVNLDAIKLDRVW